MTEVVVLPATVEHLTALRENPNAFGALLGSAVPTGWADRVALGAAGDAGYCLLNPVGRTTITTRSGASAGASVSGPL